MGRIAVPLAGAGLCGISATLAGLGIAAAGERSLGTAVALGAAGGLLNVFVWIFAVRGLLAAGMRGAGGAGALWLVTKGGLLLAAALLLTRSAYPIPAAAAFLAPLLGLTAGGLYTARRAAAHQPGRAA
jgi:hypothetical protein